ncbi:MAG: 3-deoxy-8-phosphooctulonate synthase, partial [Flavobacteriales bacterium]|nr:3-deoxy-8-phosphooctulonate synthase [Flavobacteriales bacterium]
MIENLPKIKNTENGRFFLIAGPCAIESEDLAFEVAGTVKEITDRLGIPYIFKGSYRKANRSRLDSFTGIGDEKALKILQKVGKELDLPVTSDIHCAAVSYIDVEFVF